MCGREYRASCDICAGRHENFLPQRPLSVDANSTHSRKRVITNTAPRDGFCRNKLVNHNVTASGLSSGTLARSFPLITPTFQLLNKKERLGYGCRHHSNIHHSIKYSNLSNLRHVFPRFSREFHQSAPHEHLPFSARRSSEPFPPFRLISTFRSPHDPATGRIPCGDRLSRLVARDLGQTFGVAGRSLANTPCARVRNVGARNAELK